MFRWPMIVQLLGTGLLWFVLIKSQECEVPVENNNIVLINDGAVAKFGCDFGYDPEEFDLTCTAGTISLDDFTCVKRADQLPDCTYRRLECEEVAETRDMCPYICAQPIADLLDYCPIYRLYCLDVTTQKGEPVVKGIVENCTETCSKPVIDDEAAVVALTNNDCATNALFCHTSAKIMQLCPATCNQPVVDTWSDPDPAKTCEVFAANASADGSNCLDTADVRRTCTKTCKMKMDETMKTFNLLPIVY